VSHILTSDQLAARWLTSRGYLANLRSQGKGCPYVKLGRLPNDVNFGKILRQMAPSFEKKKLGSRMAEGDTSYAYFKSDLEVLRREFDRYIGGSISWE
jgi:hypothetical protein